MTMPKNAVNSRSPAGCGHLAISLPAGKIVLLPLVNHFVAMKIHKNQCFTLKPVGRRAAEFQRLGSGMAAEFAAQN
jgi:hypothetical protein